MAEPCLYIIMRTDIRSLRFAGKAAAQAAHAANAFQTLMLRARDSRHAQPVQNALDPAFIEWGEHPECQGFGTTIVLGHKGDVSALIRQAQSEAFVADLIVDHSFPVEDGKARVYAPVTTCGYVFTEDRHTNYPACVKGLKLL